MNILENLKKPWVIYAGLGLGAIVLITKATGGNSAPAQNTKAVADYQAAMNVAGMNYMQHLYDEAVTYSIAQTDADIKMKALVAGVIVSLNETSSIAQTNLANINAGITNSVIAAHTALDLDRQQNAARALLYGMIGSNTQDNTGGLTTPQLAEQNA